MAILKIILDQLPGFITNVANTLTSTLIIWIIVKLVKKKQTFKEKKRNNFPNSKKSTKNKTGNNIVNEGNNNNTTTGNNSPIQISNTTIHQNDPEIIESEENKTKLFTLLENKDHFIKIIKEDRYQMYYKANTDGLKKGLSTNFKNVGITTSHPKAKEFSEIENKFQNILSKFIENKDEKIFLQNWTLPLDRLTSLFKKDD